MELGDKLKLYKGILLGKTGNAMDAKFKLVGTIARYGVDNLYEGIRLDDVDELDFLLDFVGRDRKNPDRIYFWFGGKKYDARRTVFRRDAGSRYYYDVLDDKPCTLIDRFNSKAEHGCCNIQKVKSYENLTSLRIGKRI